MSLKERRKVEHVPKRSINKQVEKLSFFSTMLVTKVEYRGVDGKWMCCTCIICPTNISKIVENIKEMANGPKKDTANTKMLESLIFKDELTGKEGLRVPYLDKNIYKKLNKKLVWYYKKEDYMNLGYDAYTIEINGVTKTKHDPLEEHMILFDGLFYEFQCLKTLKPHLNKMLYGEFINFHLGNSEQRKGLWGVDFSEFVTADIPLYFNIFSPIVKFDDINTISNNDIITYKLSNQEIELIDKEVLSSKNLNKDELKKTLTNELVKKKQDEKRQEIKEKEIERVGKEIEEKRIQSPLFNFLQNLSKKSLENLEIEPQNFTPKGPYRNKNVFFININENESILKIKTSFLQYKRLSSKSEKLKKFDYFKEEIPSIEDLIKSFNDGDLDLTSFYINKKDEVKNEEIIDEEIDINALDLEETWNGNINEEVENKEKIVDLKIEKKSFIEGKQKLIAFENFSNPIYPEKKEFNGVENKKFVPEKALEVKELLETLHEGIRDVVFEGPPKVVKNNRDVLCFKCNFVLSIEDNKKFTSSNQEEGEIIKRSVIHLTGVINDNISLREVFLTNNQILFENLYFVNRPQIIFEFEKRYETEIKPNESKEWEGAITTNYIHSNLLSYLNTFGLKISIDNDPYFIYEYVSIMNDINSFYLNPKKPSFTCSKSLLFKDDYKKEINIYLNQSPLLIVRKFKKDCVIKDGICLLDESPFFVHNNKNEYRVLFYVNDLSGYCVKGNEPKDLFKNLRVGEIFNNNKKLVENKLKEITAYTISPKWVIFCNRRFIRLSLYHTINTIKSSLTEIVLIKNLDSLLQRIAKINKEEYEKTLESEKFVPKDKSDESLFSPSLEISLKHLLLNVGFAFYQISDYYKDLKKRNLQENGNTVPIKVKKVELEEEEEEEEEEYDIPDN